MFGVYIENNDYIIVKNFMQLHLSNQNLVKASFLMGFYFPIWHWKQKELFLMSAFLRKLVSRMFFTSAVYPLDYQL
jgi:hypothetical protein